MKEYIKCTYCYGTGWVHVYSLLAKNPCPRCNGDGKIIKNSLMDKLNQEHENERNSRNTHQNGI